MSEKFAKISNYIIATFGIVFGLFVLLAIFFPILGGDYFLLDSDFLEQLIVKPMIAGLTLKVSSAFAIIIGILLLAMLAWIVFVTIRAIKGIENPGFFKYITLAIAGVGFIFAIVNFIWVLAYEIAISTIVAILFGLFFAFVALFETLKIFR